MKDKQIFSWVIGLSLLLLVIGFVINQEEPSFRLIQIARNGSIQTNGEYRVADGKLVLTTRFTPLDSNGFTEEKREEVRFQRLMIYSFEPQLDPQLLLEDPEMYDRHLGWNLTSEPIPVRVIPTTDGIRLDFSGFSQHFTFINEERTLLRGENGVEYYVVEGSL